MRHWLVVLLTVVAVSARPWIFSVEEWPPFVIKGPNNLFAGFEFELVSTVLDSMKQQKSVQESNWGTQLQMLQAGKIDLVSGGGYTKSRAKFAHYSIPIRTESFSIFIKRTVEIDKKNDAEILAMFRTGKIIPTVNSYYSYGDSINGILAKPELQARIILPGQKQICAMYLSDAIPAFLMETAVGMYRLPKTVLKSSTRRVELPSGGPIHVMFSKASVTAAEVDQFNAVFSRLIKNGSLTALYSKYNVAIPAVK